MNERTRVTEAAPIKTLPDAQTVTEVQHYTDRLFRFRVTRPASLRFRSGEFVMIGLMGDNGKPLLRAYSIASPSWDEELEFYSIKVQDGPLTSKLQHIKPGDQVILRPKPVGTLVHDALLPGKRVWFFATGTGIAPFASLIRDPETYERYDQVILTHTCRDAAELTYGADLVASLRSDEMLQELLGDGIDKLVYSVPRPRHHRFRPRDRPGDGLRFDGAEPRPEADPRRPRPARGRQLRAGRVRGREGLRRLTHASAPASPRDGYSGAESAIHGNIPARDRLIAGRAAIMSTHPDRKPVFETIEGTPT